MDSKWDNQAVQAVSREYQRLYQKALDMQEEAYLMERKATELLEKAGLLQQELIVKCEHDHRDELRCTMCGIYWSVIHTVDPPKN